MSTLATPQPPRMEREDIQKQFDKIRSQYSESSKTFTALVYGEWGCGKTTFLGTGRKPILIDSFDPGGAKVLRKQIEAGEVLVRDFSNEDSDHPTQYILWEQQFERDLKSGFFDNFGTYAIDSLSTMLQSMLNYTANKAKNPDNIPSPREYMIVGKTISDVVKLASGADCDFIMTAHMEMDKDEFLGRIFANIRGFRSVKADLPILFDEKLFLRNSTTPQGTVYEVLTQTNGLYKASTRLGANGVFKPVMPANIKELLKAAGLSTEDKSLFKEESSA